MEGYTGTLGGYVLAMADSLMREGTETMPERKLSDYPVLKRFFAKKEGKYNQAEFYDLMQSAQRASASLRKLEEDGDFEAYHNLLQAKSGLLSIKKDIDYLGDKLRDLRKQRRCLKKRSSLMKQRSIMMSCQSSEISEGQFASQRKRVSRPNSPYNLSV